MEIRDALSQQNGPSEASNEVQDFGRQREIKRVLHFRDIPENMPASMSIPFRFLEASLLHDRKPTVVRTLVPTQVAMRVPAELAHLHPSALANNPQEETTIASSLHGAVELRIRTTCKQCGKTWPRNVNGRQWP